MLLAHGIGDRADLPVPFWLALYGAGAAVVFSFAALGVLWPSPRLRGGEAGRPVPNWLAKTLDSPVTRWALRTLVLVVSVTLLLAALFGAPAADDNPAPWWFFITFWVGLVPLSLLAGPVWRVVNPLRTVHELVARLSGSDPAVGVRELPAHVGYWPAAIQLLVFAVLELVYPYRDQPRTVGTFLAVYAAVNLVAASLYGNGWFARGDGFEVYSSLVARLSPLGRRDDGKLVVRNPLNGLAALEPAPGLVAVVTILLGSTAFDGVTRSRWWASWVGPRGGWPLVPKASLALAACMVVVAASYLVAVRLAARPAQADPAAMPGAFVHSLVPIVIGYAIAHYFSLFVLDGQRALILASDPFHTGANVFGTAYWFVNYILVSPRTIAVVQVGAIVAGHIVGVVAAHDRAVSLFPGRAAVRGQYPLLAVMVGYTLGGVALLLGS